MKPEVKPINNGTARPPRGQLTPIAIGGVILFLILLALVVIRPAVSMRDGPTGESGTKDGGTTSSPSATTGL